MNITHLVQHILVKHEAPRAFRLLAASLLAAFLFVPTLRAVNTASSAALPRATEPLAVAPHAAADTLARSARQSGAAPLPAAQTLKQARGPWLALKTNALYWATTTPNLGAELRLARHFTLECEVGLNPFKHQRADGSYGRSFRHLRVHPELRYWFCEAFYKHFVGLHVPYVNYNISDIKLLSTDDKRKQGWGAGLGLSYGYDWAISKHWNLEGTLGAGWLHLDHKVYPCANCGTVRAHERKNYFGLTQAALSLSYLF